LLPQANIEMKSPQAENDSNVATTSNVPASENAQTGTVKFNAASKDDTPSRGVDDSVEHRLNVETASSQSPEQQLETFESVREVTNTKKLEDNFNSRKAVVKEV
jgi:hypothetical protein